MLKNSVFFISLTGFLLVFVFRMDAQNAPRTIAGNILACSSEQCLMPVTVSNFTAIGSISLRIEYDPALLTFIEGTNINESLTGMEFHDNPVNDLKRKIMIVWANITPVHLADGAKLFDLKFTYLTGAAAVHFNNAANGGIECEYTDAEGDPLNDIPTGSYYTDGQIHTTVGPSGDITGPSTVCQGQPGVNYNVPPIANATGYVWILPAGITIISGENSNNIVVDFESTAQSGNISVYGTNKCGNGAVSEAFPVFVNHLPGNAGMISGPSEVQQGQTNVPYSIDIIGNSAFYLWSLPSGATIISGDSSNTIVVNFSASAQSGIMTVFGGNDCGYGAPSEEFSITVNPVVPPLLQLPSYTVYNGESICFNATSTITAGGQGKTFTVENGGLATMIAGKNIRLLEGAIVHPGGHLRGHITLAGDYCQNPQQPIVTNTSIVEKTFGTGDIKQEFYKVFPNPTNGKFSIAFPPENPLISYTLTIYDHMGKMIFQELINDVSKNEFSLESRPPGIYILCIRENNFIKINKIIKY